jgi:hypothetical protein
LSVGSVAAQAAFSVVQIVNGESPDRLYFLGSQMGGRISTVDVFGWGFEAGLYAGGFVGSSRDLGVLVLLTAPAAVYFASMERRSTVPYLLFLALGAVQLPFTYGVSMFGSFLVLSTLLVLVVLLWVRSVYPTLILRRAAGSILVMPFVLGAIYVRAVLALATGLVNTPASLVPKPGGGSDDVEPSLTESQRESPSGNGTTSTPAGNETPTPTDTPAKNGDSTPGGQDPVTRGLKDPERIVVDFVDTLPLASTDTLPYRITQYDAAVRMALDFPLFGVGGYNFKLLSKEYDGFRQLNAVHNTFIVYLAGSGFSGLVFYLVCVLLVLGCTNSLRIRRTRRSRCSSEPEWSRSTPRRSGRSVHYLRTLRGALADRRPRRGERVVFSCQRASHRPDRPHDQPWGRSSWIAYHRPSGSRSPERGGRAINTRHRVRSIPVPWGQ